MSKQSHFFRADFLSVWAAPSLLPPPPPSQPLLHFLQYLSPPLRAQGPKHACHAFTTFELCSELK
jgi:hypothetical protein